MKILVALCDKGTHMLNYLIIHVIIVYTNYLFDLILGLYLVSFKLSKHRVIVLSALKFVVLKPMFFCKNYFKIWQCIHWTFC